MNRWTQEETSKAQGMRAEGLSDEEIGFYIGRTGHAVRIHLGRINRKSALTFPEIPSGDEPIELILEQKKSRFERLKEREQALKLVEIRANSNLPIGIVHFGDPHLDDDGTDIGKLIEHINLVKATDGMYAASAGDMNNNWVGRLARLYANQETSERTAIRLAEWFINELDWIYIIGGNHDVWSGNQDPIKWLSRQAGVHYEWHGTRIGITFPNGRQCRINARHDFKGHSQWNILHAAIKAAKLGPRDDMFVCGHRHSSAHMVHQVDGKPVHCIMVAGYKRYDDYAKQNDFQGAEFMESCVTIINPLSDEYNLVRVFTDVKEGCEYLTYLREKVA